MPVTGGNAFQRTIELLVRADPSAIQGLTTAFQQNQAVFEAYAQATARGTITTAEYLANTKALAAEQTQLARAIDIGTQAATGMTAAQTAAAERTKGFAFTILATSHALQDLQYGFSAVVNNIPTVVYGIGSAVGASTTAIAAWGGALMGIGVVFQILTPTILEFGRQLGVLNNPATKFVVTVDDMKNKLKALTDHPWWVTIDTSRIEYATNQLAAMEKNLQAFKAAEETDIAATSKKEATRALTDFGGGASEVEAALLRMEQLAGVSHADPALQKKIDALKKGIASGPSGFGATFDAAQEQRMKDELGPLLAAARAQDMAWAQQEVGRFATGDFGAVQTMQQRAVNMPGFFQQKGQGGVTLAEALANMAGSPEEARRRADQDLDLTDMDEREKANLDKHKLAQQARKEFEQRAIAESTAIDQDAAQVARDAEIARKQKQAAAIATSNAFDQDRAKEARDAAAAERLAARQGKADLREGKKLEKDALRDMRLDDQYAQKEVGPAYMKNVAMQVGAGNLSAFEAQQKVGVDLASVGIDPALAGEMVRKSLADLQRAYIQALARTNNDQMATVQVLQTYAQDIARMNNQAFMQSQRARNQRPSINNTFN